MPNIHSISCRLDGGREVYRPGELIQGQWTVEVGEAFTIRGVRSSVHAAAYTRWSGDKHSDPDKVGYESFFMQRFTVFGKKAGENGTVTLPEGIHTYRINFKLPTEGLPSSIEGFYGAVRYWLKLEIDRPTFRFNIRRLRPFTCLDNLNVNTRDMQIPIKRNTSTTVSKLLGFGVRGSVDLHVETDRKGYCPGEAVAITLKAVNSSDKDVGAVSASLVQIVRFTANGEEKTREYVLRNVVGTAIKKNDTRIWKNELVKIDAIPPSTRARTCQIVFVSYVVRVKVDTPILSGADATVTLPIVIGTVPKGHPGPAQHSAGASLEVDASQSITYCECNKGVRTFGEGTFPTFPVMEYRPWCAFVPDFRFKERTSQQATQNQNQQSAQQRRQATPPKKSQGQVQTKLPPTTTSNQRNVPAQNLQTTIPLPAYTSPEPSAPPPPSYEEAVAMVECPKEVKSLQTPVAKDDAADSEDEPKKKEEPGAYLFLRFFTPGIATLIDILRENGAVLREYKGDLVALAPQVIVNTGSWPQLTSLAVFSFSCVQSAKDWFPSFAEEAKKANVNLLDGFITPSREDYEEGKSVFSMTVSAKKPKAVSALWKKLLALAAKVRLIRLKLGGTLISVSWKPEMILGEWLGNELVTLTQFESLSKYYEYVHALKDPDIEGYKDLRDQCMTVMKAVVFQTIDLSFMEYDDTKERLEAERQLSVEESREENDTKMTVAELSQEEKEDATTDDGERQISVESDTADQCAGSNNSTASGSIEGASKLTEGKAVEIPRTEERNGAKASSDKTDSEDSKADESIEEAETHLNVNHFKNIL